MDVAGVVVTDGRLEVAEDPAREVVDRLKGFLSGGSGGAASLLLPAFAKALLRDANEDFFVGPGVPAEILGLAVPMGGAREMVPTAPLFDSVEPNPLPEMDDSMDAEESLREWK
jgi:hypothetical protein